MKALLPALSFILMLGLAGQAGAHEVHVQVSPTQAALIQLSYADGQPFAFEAYELYPGAAELPAQVGRTDAQGRVVFLPGGTADWRLKAYAADGHGTDQRLQVALPEQPAVAPDAAPAQGLDRFSRLLLGLSLILGGFGLYQFFTCKKRKSSP